METKIQTGLKNFKPKKNLNHNTYPALSSGEFLLKVQKRSTTLRLSASIVDRSIYKPCRVIWENKLETR